jgi:hypothetical protein
VEEADNQVMPALARGDWYQGDHGMSSELPILPGNRVLLRAARPSERSHVIVAAGLSSRLVNLYS